MWHGEVFIFCLIAALLIILWKNDAQYTGILSNLNGTKIFKWWTKGIESSQPSRVAEAAAEMAQKVRIRSFYSHLILKMNLIIARKSSLNY